jgi:hypothetical protein
MGRLVGLALERWKRKQGGDTIFWQHQRLAAGCSLLIFAASSFPFLAENFRDKEEDERKVFKNCKTYILVLE